jgi:cytochrome P450
MGYGWMLVLMVYGGPWRERRRMFQKYFNASNTQLYRPNQIEFIHKMLRDLLEKPEEFLSISRQ